MAHERCWSVMVGARSGGAKAGVFRGSDDRLLQEITTRHFPEGYTILRSTGGWFDPERKKFTREESRQVLICSRQASAVRRWAREIGAALRQRELLLVEQGRVTRVETVRRRDRS